MEAAENEKKQKQVKKKKQTKIKTKQKKVTNEISSSEEDGEVMEAGGEQDAGVTKAAGNKKNEKQANKKKKDPKMKAKKKKMPEETSTSEEDGEVDYVESGESEWNEQSDASNEEEIIDQATKLHNQRKGSEQRKRKRSVTKDSSSESELPLTKVANSNNVSWNKNLKNGCYVIIKYEGEYFPGKIEKKEGGLYEISTMVLSTGNTFRWPERPDKIWYTIRDIVEIITPPVKHNNRGFFKIAEMEKFLPDIYNM